MSKMRVDTVEWCGRPTGSRRLFSDGVPGAGHGVDCSCIVRLWEVISAKRNVYK